MEGNLPPYFGHALLEKKKGIFLLEESPAMSQL